MLYRYLTIIIAYFATYQLAGLSQVAKDASAFYPSAGVLIFFVYRWGWKVLPATVLAMLTVGAYEHPFLERSLFNNLALLRQLFTYGGGALLARHYRWIKLPVDGLNDALKLLGLTLACSLVSAILAMGSFWWLVPDLRPVIAYIFLGFWLGDFTGALMFLGATSVVMALVQHARNRRVVSELLSPKRVTLLMSATAVVIMLMAALITTGQLRSYSYLMLLPVIAGAIAFGFNFGTTLAILANLSAVLTYILLQSDQMDPIQVQSLCAVVVVVGMLLGAAINDRRAALNAAEAQAKDLRELTLSLTQVEQNANDHLYQLLHDEVQPLLVAARLSLSSLASTTPAAIREQIISESCDHIGTVLGIARTLSIETSPPLLRERNLGEAIESLIRWVNATYKLDIETHMIADHFPNQIDLCQLCFNAVRELLLNIVKHAGVKHAVLTLTNPGSDELQITVEDQGCGFDTKVNCNGTGLQSIARRLERVGGRLDLVSSPNAGTCICISVPLAHGDTITVANDPNLFRNRRSAHA